MVVPQKEIEEVIDRFEKDIEQGISSRNWLPYLAKIRAWLASGPTWHTCPVCGNPVEEPYTIHGECAAKIDRGA